MNLRRRARLAALLLGLAALGLPSACTSSVASSGASPHVLTQDEGWMLSVIDSPEGPELQLRFEQVGADGARGVSDYTRPVTLNEVSAFRVNRDGHDITLVAGPIHEDAEDVEIASVDGAAADATLDAAQGFTWFWTDLPGSQQVAAITAYNADGEVLDEYTLPPMPPPPPSHVPADPGDQPPD